MNRKVWIGIITSIDFLFLAFGKTDFNELKRELEVAAYLCVIPAVVLNITSLWFRSVRW